MPIGPGKYDALCSQVREQAKARGAIVIIFDGDKGSGFSVQADGLVTLGLPDLLETIAADIRKSFQEGKV